MSLKYEPASRPHIAHRSRQPSAIPRRVLEREFFIDNLLVRIHLIIEMIWWTSLAPWKFEFSFPGSLISTFLERVLIIGSVVGTPPNTLNPAI